MRSAVEPSGSFECSKEVLTKSIRWSGKPRRPTSHSLPTDCPQRDERMGWLNDMAARTEEAIYNFNLVRLLSKWIARYCGRAGPTHWRDHRYRSIPLGSAACRPGQRLLSIDPLAAVCALRRFHTLTERYAGMKAWVDYLTSRSEGPYSSIQLLRGLGSSDPVRLARQPRQLRRIQRYPRRADFHGMLCL